jgi:hypothetical protein
MFSISRQRNKLSFVLLLPLLSACVEGGPPSGPGGSYPPSRPEPRPEMCTMDYRPVCGERNGRFETMGNSCQARARGFRIVGSGECQGQGRPDRPDWDRPTRPDRPDWGRPDRPGGERACTREYRPVCAQRGGRTQTFPNICEAGNAGYAVIGQGECRR